MEIVKVLIIIFVAASICAGLKYTIVRLVKSYKLERQLRRQAEEEAKCLENLEERVKVLEMTAIASMLSDFLREENTNDAEN